MPPLHRDYLVIGPYTLKGGKLTFRTDGALLASDARHAMAAGRSFTVALTGPDGLKEVTGKVLSVEMVESVKPAQWEIVIRVSAAGLGLTEIAVVSDLAGQGRAGQC